MGYNNYLLLGVALAPGHVGPVKVQERTCD